MCDFQLHAKYNTVSDVSSCWHVLYASEISCYDIYQGQIESQQNKLELLQIFFIG